MTACRYCDGAHRPWEARGNRLCKAIHEFFRLGRRPERDSRPLALRGLYDVAEYLRSMASPKTLRQREFAKRYRGSMVNQPPRYRRQKTWRSARSPVPQPAEPRRP